MKRPMGSIGGDDVINKVCMQDIHTYLCIWCKSMIFLKIISGIKSVMYVRLYFVIFMSS